MIKILTYFMLFAELETVKKCTPLYGQPEWWGEDDGCEEGETICGELAL